MTSERPLSPHLQIYKPQVTSVLSITHRMTGLLIAIGMLVIALWFGSMLMGESVYKGLHAVLNSGPMRVLMIIWSWCFSYHLLNGVRHLLWDAGYGYDLAVAYQTGAVVVVGSVVLTLVVWLI